MTKDHLALLIIETIENNTKSEAHKSVVELLSALKPKSKPNFAAWGQPYEQSTPEECWE